MTLVRVDQIRGAIIDKLKANATVLALLDDNNEIRESNWKGTEFTYPNIRVRINSATPMDDCYQYLDASIFCFSEMASSQQADEMAGIITNEFHNKNFEINLIRFTKIVADVIPAIDIGAITWRSEVQILSEINLL